VWDMTEEFYALPLNTLPQTPIFLGVYDSRDRAMQAAKENPALLRGTAYQVYRKSELWFMEVPNES